MAIKLEYIGGYSCISIATAFIGLVAICSVHVVYSIQSFNQVSVKYSFYCLSLVHSCGSVTTQSIILIIASRTHLSRHGHIPSRISIRSLHLQLCQPSRTILRPYLLVEASVLGIITLKSSLGQILSMRPS
jgi:hypothetical protein